LFVRLQNGAALTETFKYSKVELMNQGFNPAATTDSIYFANPGSQGFDRLDEALYERIQMGKIRL
jgi:fatty-acyl-CoA synthase